MTLRKKMMLSFFGILFLALVLLLAAVQLVLRPYYQHQAEIETQLLINSKASETGAWLDSRIGEMRVLHTHPACRVLDLEKLKGFIGPLNEMIKEQYGNPGETIAIGGLDGKGWINENITIDISDREYFERAIKGESEYVLSAPVVSKSDAEPIFLICYPIHDNQDNIIGFINASVNLARFSNLLAQTQVYGATPWIVNREGKVYTASEEDIPKETLNEIFAEDNSAGSIPVLSKSGIKQTLIYSPVPNTDDWMLCVRIDNASMYAQIQDMTNFLLVIFGLVLLLALLLSAGISHSITKPISELKDHMSEYTGSGNRSPLEITTNDEIAVLGSTYNKMLEDMEVLSEKSLNAERQKRSAQLRALQSQIQPHFLYNTLDTIQWQAMSYGADSVVEMVQQLSLYFRRALSSGRERITVEEERQQTQAYLKIQKVRYNELLNYDIEIAPETLDLFIPKLILQPLAENSIYHGLKPANRPGNVLIKVQTEGEFIVLSVSDDGVGMSQQRLHHLREELEKHAETDHYGLFNVNERLWLEYGENYTFTIESTQNKGTTVTIKLKSEEL